MTNENLLEIIKIQSKIIDKLSEKFIGDEQFPPEKDKMRKLQKELKEKLKNL